MMNKETKQIALIMALSIVGAAVVILLSGLAANVLGR